MRPRGGTAAARSARTTHASHFARNLPLRSRHSSRPLWLLHWYTATHSGTPFVKLASTRATLDTRQSTTPTRPYEHARSRSRQCATIHLADPAIQPDTFRGLHGANRRSMPGRRRSNYCRRVEGRGMRSQGSMGREETVREPCVGTDNSVRGASALRAWGPTFGSTGRRSDVNDHPGRGWAGLAGLPRLAGSNSSRIREPGNPSTYSF